MAPVVGTKTERHTVWLNRYEEAMRAGMKAKEARAFADSNVNVGELRELVRRGCPPALLARIML